MIKVPLSAAVRRKSLDLLARAALAPHDQALTAWNEWRASYDIETTPWGEVRMLGAVAPRITDLEPDASIRPRVLGIRKFLWVQSQICLRHAAGGLAALRRAGVPVLLMKGAARIAADPISAQERLIRDVDALVPLEERQRAFEVLQDEQWTLVPHKWQTELHAWSPVAAHHAWSMSKGGSEIDLHHFSNHLNRLRGDDDGLWARSRTLQWRGIDLRVPSPADALLLALVHGARWSGDPSADWVVDASALLDAGNIDWDVFLEESKARVLNAVLLSGLVYFRDRLLRDVPTHVMDHLAAAECEEQRAELRQYASAALPLNETQKSVALKMAVRRAVARTPEVFRKPGEGEPVLLSSYSFRPSATRRKLIVDLPSRSQTFGSILVRVVVNGVDGRGNGPVVCGFDAPGLCPGTRITKPCDPHRRDSPQEATLELPEALLELRGIRNLRLSFRPRNSRIDLTAVVHVLRRD